MALPIAERVDPSWIPCRQAHPGSTSASVSDIGLVTLNSTVGNLTGWFGFGYNTNNAAFAGATMDTAGYPASYGCSGKQMYFSAGPVNGVQGNSTSPGIKTGISTRDNGGTSGLPAQTGSDLADTSGSPDAAIENALPIAGGRTRR
jgi:hypothetical protein